MMILIKDAGTATYKSWCKLMVSWEWYKMKNTQIVHFFISVVHTILTNQETTLLNGQK